MKKFYCNGKKDFCPAYDGEDLPNCELEKCEYFNDDGGEVIDTEAPQKALYLCDLKKCDNCSYPTCTHTTDIEHAVNFKFNGVCYEEPDGVAIALNKTFITE